MTTINITPTFNVYYDWNHTWATTYIWTDSEPVVKSWDSAGEIDWALDVGETIDWQDFWVTSNFNEIFSIVDTFKTTIHKNINETIYIKEQVQGGGTLSDVLMFNTPLSITNIRDLIRKGHAPGFSDFKTFIRGDYRYKDAIYRITMGTTDINAKLVLDKLDLDIDVLDIVDSGNANITDANAGVSITFNKPFTYSSNSYPYSPQISIIGQSSSPVTGAYDPTTLTTTGVTAYLYNSSGTKITGTITWFARGY